MRGASTLSLRMQQHQKNGIKVSNFLESHPKVSAVFYPGLESHPQHEIARRQMDNFSGMLGFRLSSEFKGKEAAEKIDSGLARNKVRRIFGASSFVDMVHANRGPHAKQF